jgi:phosphatidylinositol alpha-1,6-mannosyltransferase
VRQNLPHDSDTPIVALLPSIDLGGGIEMYARGVLEALDDSGLEIAVVALSDASHVAPTLSTKVRFIVRALRHCRPRNGKSRVLIFHSSFAALAVVIRLLAIGRQRQLTMFFYGREIWSPTRLDRFALKHAQCDFMTISSFSAGGIAHLGSVRVLEPGVPRAWFNQLSEVAP